MDGNGRWAQRRGLARNEGHRRGKDSVRAVVETAARRIAQAAVAGEVRPDEIDEAMFARSLATCGLPDPDLLIRTSGELRISNFFLFQIAYTELYFTDALWPDFREREFLEAL